MRLHHKEVFLKNPNRIKYPLPTMQKLLGPAPHSAHVLSGTYSCEELRQTTLLLPPNPGWFHVLPEAIWKF